jgi:hypothetical protein
MKDGRNGIQNTYMFSYVSECSNTKSNILSIFQIFLLFSSEKN